MYQRTFIWMLILSLLVSTLPVVLSQQVPPNYFVYGNVYSSTGAPVPAAVTVYITDVDISKCVTDGTDASGFYQRDVGSFAIPDVVIGHSFIVNATCQGESGNCAFVFDPVANPSQRCDIHLGVAKEEEGRMEVASTSGGGSQEPHPSAITEIKTTSAGVVTESVTVTSPDEKATLMVPEGVTALNVEGNPLTQVSVATAVSIPTLPPTVSLPGPAGIDYTRYAYDLGPDGATFDPPIDFTVTFDPADFTADTKPVIYTYNEEESKWEELPTEVVGNTATTKISHFTIFVLFAVLGETISLPSILTPTPVAAQTPTVVPPVKRPWALIIGIIVAVVVIGATAYYFYTKKKRRP